MENSPFGENRLTQKYEKCLQKLSALFMLVYPNILGKAAHELLFHFENTSFLKLFYASVNLLEDMPLAQRKAIFHL